MARFSLNIYGEHDEVLKTFETDKLRWSVFIKACQAQEDIENQPLSKQVEIIGGFLKSLFIGMTDEDLAMADAADTFNVFRQISSISGSINSSKN